MAKIIATAEPLPLASLSPMRLYFADKDLREIDMKNIVKCLGALLSGTTDFTGPTGPPATIHPLHAFMPPFLISCWMKVGVVNSTLTCLTFMIVLCIMLNSQR